MKNCRMWRFGEGAGEDRFAEVIKCIMTEPNASQRRKAARARIIRRGRTHDGGRNACTGTVLLGLHALRRRTTPAWVEPCWPCNMCRKNGSLFIEIEFEDTSRHRRPVQFVDPVRSTMGDIGETGALFAAPQHGNTMSTISFRYFDTWDVDGWECELDDGREAVSVAFGRKYITVGTSLGTFVSSILVERKFYHFNRQRHCHSCALSRTTRCRRTRWGPADRAESVARDVGRSEQVNARFPPPRSFSRQDYHWLGLLQTVYCARQTVLASFVP